MLIPFLSAAVSMLLVRRHGPSPSTRLSTGLTLVTRLCRMGNFGSGVSLTTLSLRDRVFVPLL